jgi:hypothetical protein
MAKSQISPTFTSPKKHHAAWQTIKEASGKSSEKRISNWSEHCHNLLGKEPKTPDINTLPSTIISETLNINTSEFTSNELITVIKQLKNNKAFGPDNIPPIIWKDKLFHSSLLKFVIYPSLITQTHQYGVNPKSSPPQRKVIYH